MPHNNPCLRPVSLALLVVLGVPLATRGAFPETQVLRGEVVDQKNAAIAGAVCTLTGPTLPQQGRPVTTDEQGNFQFTGLIPGSYQLTCAAVGYEPVARNDIPITETQAPTLQVTLPPEVIVRQKVEVSAEAPKATLQTTAPPAIISSQQLRTLPLVEQKFKAALPLIPGVVRTPDGRIAIKGAIENQGTLLVDSAETVDPVTGSFSIDVPIDAVESVDVFKSAYQTQYGRFSGGLTSVQTKAPSNQWNFELNDFLPTPRIRSGKVVGIQDDTPRLYFTGPLWKDKLTFSESFMYVFSRQPVRGLAWPHNETRKQGFDSFTDFLFVFSPHHLTSLNAKVFPERRQFDNINSLIPQTASADYGQSGFSVGANDHYLFTGGGILTTLAQFTQFDSYSHGQGLQDMLVTPNGWLGNFFNAWTRSSAQQEVQETYQFARKEWHGRHAFKVGGDIVHRSYNGTSVSHPVQVLRADGSLAEQIDFAPAGQLTTQDTELAGFAEDHWAFNDHLALDYGLRFSGQTLGQASAISPRLGFVISPGQRGKTIFRGGVGVFYDRLPLLAGDFTQNPTRAVTLFDTQGAALGPPTVYQNFYQKFGEDGTVVPTGKVLGSTPYNVTWNAEIDQELHPNVIARISYIASRTNNEFVVDPEILPPDNAVLLLSNRGGSHYHELETTLRVRPSEKANINISYVHSQARGDLNTLSSVYVPYEAPVIRPNYLATLPTNVPHRLVIWGRFKIPWKLTVSPLLDWHTGFPYSTVDVLQNYVAAPNSHRFPAFVSLDMQVSKDSRIPLLPWLRNHTVRSSVRIYNLTNHMNFRDVYNNAASPLYGDFAGIQHRFFSLGLDIVY
jgi:hypothetical protein